MAKHYVTLKIQTLFIEPDLKNKKIYILMQIGQKLILIERELKGLKK